MHIALTTPAVCMYATWCACVLVMIASLPSGSSCDLSDTGMLISSSEAWQPVIYHRYQQERTHHPNQHAKQAKEANLSTVCLHPLCLNPYVCVCVWWERCYILHITSLW